MSEGNEMDVEEGFGNYIFIILFLVEWVVFYFFLIRVRVVGKDGL